MMTLRLPSVSDVENLFQRRSDTSVDNPTPLPKYNREVDFDRKIQLFKLCVLELKLTFFHSIIIQSKSHVVFTQNSVP